MNILVVGATGTLGRQIVFIAIDKGYKVKCLVRDFTKASFLKEWGAELVYADLTKKDTLPQALKGVSVVIDASTTRINEFYNMEKIEKDAKIALIKASEVAGVKKFIFFSVINAKQYTDLPLLKFKYEIEQYLETYSELNYTIFCLVGFFQGIINQYAIPILENQPIIITSRENFISYIDARDVAKICLASINLPIFRKKNFNLWGPKSWTAEEIIELCYRFSGQKAKTLYIPFSLIKAFRYITSLFEWTWNISNMLAFIEIFIFANQLTGNSDYLYKICNISDISNLDKYLKEYFDKVLRKIQELNYDKLRLKKK
ncbi:hypothetical protein GpartN1_CHLp186 (chloroplast) [Galdieria partita]|uniref:NmrA-like domain-containing protein n=1 Tax=Galdieria partita TaxID=83374 RepID=A0A9C7CA28_9RHOD|nr:hypothetical protein GpartN1_CHLp186 [Galdieria partita]